MIPDIDIKKPNFNTSFANSSVAVKQWIKPLKGFFLYSSFNIEIVSLSASLVCIIIGKSVLLDNSIWLINEPICNFLLLFS